MAALSAFKSGLFFTDEAAAANAINRIFLLAIRRRRRLVGIVRAVRAGAAPDYKWHVAGLEVSPAYWGRHIGRSLIAELLARIRARGGGTVRLRVHVRAVAALRLYRNAGFKHGGKPVKDYLDLSMDVS